MLRWPGIGSDDTASDLADCLGRAGIQAGAKRNGHAFGLAFEYSRCRFHGFVGDFVVQNVAFDIELHDALIHTLVLHVKVMFRNVSLSRPL
jgi:hypothetical protein